MQKPEGCQSCVLFTSGTGFCPDLVAKNPRYMILAEAPGKQEIAKGIPMVGRAGYVLHNWLLRTVAPLRLAWERSEITISNTLRCLPKEFQGRAYPRGTEKLQAEAACRQYDNMAETIHTVIMTGESPQRMLFREELEAEDKESREIGREVKGVMGRTGRVVERDGKRYVFAPHPAYILRQPALVEQGQRALQIAVNTDTVVEPTMMAWAYAVQELS